MEAERHLADLSKGPNGARLVALPRTAAGTRPLAIAAPLQRAKLSCSPPTARPPKRAEIAADPDRT